VYVLKWQKVVAVFNQELNYEFPGAVKTLRVKLCAANGLKSAGGERAGMVKT
jgi:hypothetical protein